METQLNEIIKMIQGMKTEFNKERESLKVNLANWNKTQIEKLRKPNKRFRGKTYIQTRQDRELLGLEDKAKTSIVQSMKMFFLVNHLINQKQMNK